MKSRITLSGTCERPLDMINELCCHALEFHGVVDTTDDPSGHTGSITGTIKGEIFSPHYNALISALELAHEQGCLEAFQLTYHRNLLTTAELLFRDDPTLWRDKLDNMQCLGDMCVTGNWQRKQAKVLGFITP